MILSSLLYDLPIFIMFRAYTSSILLVPVLSRSCLAISSIVISLSVLERSSSCACRDNLPRELYRILCSFSYSMLVLLALED